MFCQYCGKEVGGDAPYCTSCGRSVKPLACPVERSVSSGGGGLLKRIVVALSCGAIVVAGGAISLAILNSANYEGGDAPDVSEPTSSLSDSPNDSDLTLPQIPEASNTIVEVRSGSDIDNMDICSSARYSYNDQGQMTRKECDNYSVAWTYDSEGRLIEQSTAYYEKPEDNQVFTYSYGDEGQLTEILRNYPNRDPNTWAPLWDMVYRSVYEYSTDGTEVTETMFNTDGEVASKQVSTYNEDRRQCAPSISTEAGSMGDRIGDDDPVEVVSYDGDGDYTGYSTYAYDSFGNPILIESFNEEDILLSREDKEYDQFGNLVGATSWWSDEKYLTPSDLTYSNETDWEYNATGKPLSQTRIEHSSESDYASATSTCYYYDLHARLVATLSVFVSEANLPSSVDYTVYFYDDDNEEFGDVRYDLYTEAMDLAETALARA